METSPTGLRRQAFVYLLAGLAQLAFDSAVFVAATACGVPVAAGNLAGRIAGACLGFWLHGRYTFGAAGDARLRGRHLFRFVVAWLALTALSTVAVASVAETAGLRWSWLAKPIVEAMLALLGFVVFRNWVYR